MSAVADTYAAAPRRWKKPPFIADKRLRYTIYAGALIYLVLAISSVDVNWQRAIAGMERGQAFVSAFLAPDFTTRWTDIRQGLLESLTMTVISTVFGVILSIPVALGVARQSG